MDAARLELEGRPPDPANDLRPAERAAEREGDAWFLEEFIPHLRAQETDPAPLEAIDRMEQMAIDDIETEGANDD
jgi:hypothetical protein